MINRKPQQKDEMGKIAELEEFVPTTALGKKLLELAKQGVQKGVPRIDAEAILEELGRKKYENSDVR